MEKLSKEQLIQLLSLNEKTEPPKKARKKAELDADKKAEMLDRLEKMRATVAENRKVKKEQNPQTEQKPLANEMNVFEKRYESKFDKMTELLSTLNDNTKAVADLKREKKEAKDKEKADKAIEDKQKQEAQAAMRKLQEEQLEMARTQQYARGNSSAPPAQQPAQQTRNLVLPTVQAPLAPNMPNPLAKFSRPKPQQW
jgi:hypothetical protein